MTRPNVEIQHSFVRHVAEHEVLLSFLDDEAALAFQEWWADEGYVQFAKFCDSQEDN